MLDLARMNPVPVLLFFSVSHLGVYPLSLEHLLSTVNNSFMLDLCGCNQVEIAQPMCPSVPLVHVFPAD